jgi:hypothetical protein
MLMAYVRTEQPELPVTIQRSKRHASRGRGPVNGRPIEGVVDVLIVGLLTAL